MKAFFKHTAAVLGFIAGALALILALGPALTPKNNTESAGILSERAYGFLAEPENSLDALFFGDSEGYRAFIPLQMWEEYGVTSYVCCTSGQQFYLTESMLKQAFQTQKPKCVLLETNILYRYAPYSEVLMEKVYNALPALRYHDHWKHLSLSDFTDGVHYTHIDAFKGYAYMGAVEPANETDHMKKDSSEEKFSKYARKMLVQIDNLCKANDCQLILISTPSTVNWSMKRHNHVQKLANRLNIPYIDMNLLEEELSIDWSTDTYDGGDHLNHAGAVKASAYIGRYLSETCALPDRRGDETIASEWNENLAEFKAFLESQEQ